MKLKLRGYGRDYLPTHEKVAKWLDKFINQVQGLHVSPCIAVARIPNVSGAVDVLARIPHQEGEPPMLVDQVPFFKS